MSSTRTQVYFTDEQRRALDERAAREGKTLAQVVREAVDAHLARERPNGAAVDAVMQEFLGAAPGFDVPDRHEWDRSDRWSDW